MTSLARADLRNLRRDPMLLASGMAPLLIAGLVGFGFDPLARWASDLVDLVPHRPVVVGGALLLTPLLVGFVVGFLLVEEREEQILAAVAVTPRGTDGLLGHRLTLPAIVGGVSTAVVALVGGTPTSAGPVVVVVLAGATACVVTMGMVAIARDRVQALAVSKMTGILLVGAIAYQFVGGWWRVPLGFLPTTWVVEAAVADEPWAALAAGAGTHLVFGGLLWRRVRRLLLT